MLDTNKLQTAINLTPLRFSEVDTIYFSNSTNFSQSCVSISPLKPLKNTKNELNHRLPLILGEDGRRGLIEIGIWLSACPTKRTRRMMDPMADKYPHQSPFMFCSGNPVMRIDPIGWKMMNEHLMWIQEL